MSRPVARQLDTDEYLGRSRSYPFLRLRAGRRIVIDRRDAWVRGRLRCPVLVRAGYRRQIAEVDAGLLLHRSSPVTDVADARAHRMIRHRGWVDVLPSL
jgi:hypothetical protein